MIFIFHTFSLPWLPAVAPLQAKCVSDRLKLFGFFSVAGMECHTAKQITTPSLGWNVRPVPDTSVEEFWRWDQKNTSAPGLSWTVFRSMTVIQIECWIRWLSVISVVTTEQRHFILRLLCCWEWFPNDLDSDSFVFALANQHKFSFLFFLVPCLLF